MNSYLVKLKVNSDAVSDKGIQNETIRLKDRVNSSETLLNTGCHSIEISINEVLEAMLQKLL